jgi:hypothetical protein
MKKVTDYVPRPHSLLNLAEPLEPLYTFKDFPVFMGCVDAPPEDDLVADMAWEIGAQTGFIQLGKLLPLDILYREQHNDGTGTVWQGHYKAFADFLYKFKPKHILEIGGAHDQIATNYFAQDAAVTWTTVEPNPEHIGSDKIRVIKGWFDEAFTLDTPVDTVIHSHVFEHTYEPFKFMAHIGKFLKVGDKHIFTFPNLLPYVEKKWTNALNFEHTAFLTEEITDYILEKEGFKILEKAYYGSPHSIFYATEKVGEGRELPVPNHYEEYKKVFLDYIRFHLEMVRDLNEKMREAQGPVYLFGAHIFSQTLIQFGLETDKIIAVLDNSTLKQGKRLYGTRFTVESPHALKGQGRVNLILKAGGYNEEIKKDILENINPHVSFW